MESNKEDVPKESESLSFKYLKFVRENLALFVIVPTLLGGIWQVFPLAGIGIPYIRFFSITQLVSDGIILIGALSLITLFPLTTYWLGKVLSKLIRDWKNDFKSIFFLLILHLVSFYLLAYVIVLGLRYLSSNFKMEIDVDIIFAVFVFVPPVNFILQETSSKLRIFLKKFYDNRLKPIQKKVYQRMIILLKKIYEGYETIVLIVIVFSVLFWIIFVFRILLSIGGYYKADNLVNLTKIDEILLEDYNLKPDDFSISYMNDSYIFIEYTELSQKEIEKLIEDKKLVPYEVIILKSDVLFE